MDFDLLPSANPYSVELEKDVNDLLSVFEPTGLLPHEYAVVDVRTGLLRHEQENRVTAAVKNDRYDCHNRIWP